MGGELTVSSEIGQGSRFEFAAAFNRLKGEAFRPEEAGADDLKGTRVLVVDDNATSRRLTKEMLDSWRMADGEA